MRASERFQQIVSEQSDSLKKERKRPKIDFWRMGISDKRREIADFRNYNINKIYFVYVAGVLGRIGASRDLLQPSACASPLRTATTTGVAYGQVRHYLEALLHRDCPVFRDRIGIANDTVATMPRLPRIKETEVDFLGKNVDGSFIHVELQTRNDPAMALRMLPYLADIAVIAAPHPAGRRKLALPRIQQKVVFAGAGRPDMENFITQPPDLAYKFEILDSKTIDGSGLLESEFITDAMFAVICAEGENPATIRAILRRIAGDPSSPLMGNLTALLVLAETMGLIETVKQEISKMPITVDARNIPFIKNAIDDVAKAAVGALLRAKFPGTAGLDEILLNVTAENSDELIVRIVKASSLQEAIGPEHVSRNRSRE